MTDFSKYTIKSEDAKKKDYSKYNFFKADNSQAAQDLKYGKYNFYKQHKEYEYNKLLNQFNNFYIQKNKTSMYPQEGLIDIRRDYQNKQMANAAIKYAELQNQKKAAEYKEATKDNSNFFKSAFNIGKSFITGIAESLTDTTKATYDNSPYEETDTGWYSDSKSKTQTNNLGDILAAGLDPENEFGTTESPWNYSESHTQDEINYYNAHIAEKLAADQEYYNTHRDPNIFRTVSYTDPSDPNYWYNHSSSEAGVPGSLNISGMLRALEQSTGKTAAEWYTEIYDKLIKERTKIDTESAVTTITADGTPIIVQNDVYRDPVFTDEQMCRSSAIRTVEGMIMDSWLSDAYGTPTTMNTKIKEGMSSMRREYMDRILVKPLNIDGSMENVDWNMLFINNIVSYFQDVDWLSTFVKSALPSSITSGKYYPELEDYNGVWAEPWSKTKERLKTAAGIGYKGRTYFDSDWQTGFRPADLGLNLATEWASDPLNIAKAAYGFAEKIDISRLINNSKSLKNLFLDNTWLKEANIDANTVLKNTNLIKSILDNNETLMKDTLANIVENNIKNVDAYTKAAYTKILQDSFSDFLKEISTVSNLKRDIDLIRAVDDLRRVQGKHKVVTTLDDIMTDVAGMPLITPTKTMLKWGTSSIFSFITNKFKRASRDFLKEQNTGNIFDNRVELEYVSQALAERLHNTGALSKRIFEVIKDMNDETASTNIKSMADYLYNISEAIAKGEASPFEVLDSFQNQYGLFGYKSFTGIFDDIYQVKKTFPDVKIDKTTSIKLKGARAILGATGTSKFVDIANYKTFVSDILPSVDSFKTTAFNGLYDELLVTHGNEFIHASVVDSFNKIAERFASIDPRDFDIQKIYSAYLDPKVDHTLNGLNNSINIILETQDELADNAKIATAYFRDVQALRHIDTSNINNAFDSVYDAISETFQKVDSDYLKFAKTKNMDTVIKDLESIFGTDYIKENFSDEFNVIKNINLNKATEEELLSYHNSLRSIRTKVNNEWSVAVNDMLYNSFSDSDKVVAQNKVKTLLDTQNKLATLEPENIANSFNSDDAIIELHTEKFHANNVKYNSTYADGVRALYSDGDTLTSAQFELLKQDLSNTDLANVENIAVIQDAIADLDPIARKLIIYDLIQKNAALYFSDKTTYVAVMQEVHNYAKMSSAEFANSNIALRMMEHIQAHIDSISLSKPLRQDYTKKMLQESSEASTVMHQFIRSLCASDEEYNSLIKSIYEEQHLSPFVDSIISETRLELDDPEYAALLRTKRAVYMDTEGSGLNTNTGHLYSIGSHMAGNKNIGFNDQIKLHRDHLMEVIPDTDWLYKSFGKDLTYEEALEKFLTKYSVADTEAEFTEVDLIYAYNQWLIDNDINIIAGMNTANYDNLLIDSVVRRNNMFDYTKDRVTNTISNIRYRYGEITETDDFIDIYPKLREANGVHSATAEDLAKLRNFCTYIADLTEGQTELFDFDESTLVKSVDTITKNVNTLVANGKLSPNLDLVKHLNELSKGAEEYQRNISSGLITPVTVINTFADTDTTFQRFLSDQATKNGLDAIDPSIAYTIKWNPEITNKYVDANKLPTCGLDRYEIYEHLKNIDDIKSTKIKNIDDLYKAKIFINDSDLKAKTYSLLEQQRLNQFSWAYCIDPTKINTPEECLAVYYEILSSSTQNEPVSRILELIRTKAFRQYEPFESNINHSIPKYVNIQDIINNNADASDALINYRGIMDREYGFNTNDFVLNQNMQPFRHKILEPLEGFSEHEKRIIKDRMNKALEKSDWDIKEYRRVRYLKTDMAGRPYGINKENLISDLLYGGNFKYFEDVPEYRYTQNTLKRIKEYQVFLNQLTDADTVKELEDAGVKVFKDSNGTVWVGLMDVSSNVAKTKDGYSFKGIEYTNKHVVMEHVSLNPKNNITDPKMFQYVMDVDNTLRTMVDQMRIATNNAYDGYTNALSPRNYRDHLLKMPKEVKESMGDMNNYIKDYFSTPRFDTINDTPYILTENTPNLLSLIQNNYGKALMTDVSGYAYMYPFCSKDLRFSFSDITDKATDDEIIRIHNDGTTSGLVLCAFTKPIISNKHHFDLTEIKIRNSADIRKASELDAVYIPYQVYVNLKESLDSDEGFAKLTRKAMAVYKLGYLMNTGAGLRNLRDSMLKTFIEGGDLHTTLRATLNSVKLNKMYDDTVTAMGKEDPNFSFTDANISRFFVDHPELKMDEEQFMYVHRLRQSPLGVGEVGSLKLFNDYKPKTLIDKFKTVPNVILKPMEFAEVNARMGLFSSLQQQGYTISQALAKVDYTHYNYKVLSPMMRKIQLIIPFANFRILNLDYWLDKFNSTPALMKLSLEELHSSWNAAGFTAEQYATNKSMQYAMIHGYQPLTDKVYLKVNPSYLDLLNFIFNPKETISDGIFEPWKIGIKRTMELCNNASKGKFEADVCTAFFGIGNVMSDEEADDKLINIFLNWLNENSDFIPILGPIWQRYIKWDDPTTKTDESSTARKNFERLKGRPIEQFFATVFPDIFGTVKEYSAFKWLESIPAKSQIPEANYNPLQDLRHYKAMEDLQYNEDYIAYIKQLQGYNPDELTEGEKKSLEWRTSDVYPYSSPEQKLYFERLDATQTDPWYSTYDYVKWLKLKTFIDQGIYTREDTPLEYYKALIEMDELCPYGEYSTAYEQEYYTQLLQNYKMDPGYYLSKDSTVELRNYLLEVNTKESIVLADKIYNRMFNKEAAKYDESIELEDNYKIINTELGFEIYNYMKSIAHNLDIDYDHRQLAKDYGKLLETPYSSVAQMNYFSWRRSSIYPYSSVKQKRYIESQLEMEKDPWYKTKEYEQYAALKAAMPDVKTDPKSYFKTWETLKELNPYFPYSSKAEKDYYEAKVAKYIANPLPFNNPFSSPKQMKFFKWATNPYFPYSSEKQKNYFEGRYSRANFNYYPKGYYYRHNYRYNSDSTFNKAYRAYRKRTKTGVDIGLNIAQLHLGLGVA